MGWLSTLAKGRADEVHEILAPLIRAGLKPSKTMSGAILVVAADGATLLFLATANYGGEDYHVEMDLLSQLFDWTKSGGAPFFLAAGCTVYLYVYHSPCKICVLKLERTIKIWRKKNPTAKWKLGFSSWYVGDGRDRYANWIAASQEYGKVLAPAGWKLKQVA